MIRILLLITLMFATSACATVPTDFPQTSQQKENPGRLYETDRFDQMLLQGPQSQSLGNSSGVTLNPTENLFYVIHNNDNQIHIFDSSQRGPLIALQKIELSGWENSSILNDSDLEDLVYLGKNELGQDEVAMVNEGNPNQGAQVYICPIHRFMQRLERSLCDRIHVEIKVDKKNKGIEGLAYDKAKNNFYVAVEGNEKGGHIQIAYFQRPADSDFQTDPTGARRMSRVTSRALFDAETKLGKLAPDLSSLFWSEKKQRLYVLSDVGARILDVDLKGQIHGVFPLPGGLQFEGLCLDRDDSLVLISEPNLSFRFSPIH